MCLHSYNDTSYDCIANGFRRCDSPPLNTHAHPTLGMIKQYKSRTASKQALSKLMFDCLLDPNMILRLLAQN